MAIQVADNFQYLGQKPLDARVKYATVADMAAVAASNLYDGIMAYVVATEKNYQWKSTNTVDETLGKWREFQSGGGGTSELANLDDVDLDDPIDGEVLKYDEETGKWVNGEDIGGTGRAKSTAIAPVFDETATYAAGDRVTYEDELYVFNTAHTGAWDAADVDKTDVDSEIPDKLTSQQMQEIKDAFVIDSPRNGYPVLFDETGAEHFVGWYKYANGTKKPIYQKTFNVNATVNIDPPITICTKSSLNLDTIVDYRGNGFANSSSSDQRLFASVMGHVFTEGENVKYYSQYNSIYVKSITIQYTKTTDTPQ